MNCVILAGGRPSLDDPLWEYTQGEPKALLRVGRLTLLEHVVRAVQAALLIEKILIVGISKNEAPDLGDYIEQMPDHGSLVSNGLAAVDWVQNHWSPADPVFFCSSDIPLITGEIVDDFVNACLPLDFAAYYCMVRKETLEKRFPGSRRSYVRLDDLHVAGGDVLIARPKLASNHRQLLDSMAAGRKHAWKLARIVGPATLIKFLLRKLTIQDIEQRASQVIGQPVKVILSPHAELAMDVDKPQQLEILRAKE